LHPSSDIRVSSGEVIYFLAHGNTIFDKIVSLIIYVFDLGVIQPMRLILG